MADMCVEAAQLQREQAISVLQQVQQTCSHRHSISKDKEEKKQFFPLRNSFQQF